MSRSDRRGASTGVRRTVFEDLQCPARLPDASTMQGCKRLCARRLPFILPLDHETAFLCPSPVTSPRAPFLPTRADDAFGSWVYPHVSAPLSDTCFVLPPSPGTAPDPSFPSTSAGLETVTDITGSDVEEMEARMQTKPVHRRVLATRCSHVGCSRTHVACAPGDGRDPRTCPWNPKASWKKQGHLWCRSNPVLGRQILEGVGLWRSSAE